MAATSNAAMNAIGTLLNSGYIKIYTTPQPADANTAISSQTLLSTLTFGATAFGGSSGGVITANAITADTNAAATGTAVWARLTKSDGTAVCDASVGTSGTDLIINNTSIQSGTEVDCSSLTITGTES